MIYEILQLKKKKTISFFVSLTKSRNINYLIKSFTFHPSRGSISGRMGLRVGDGRYPNRDENPPRGLEFCLVLCEPTWFSRNRTHQFACLLASEEEVDHGPSPSLL